MQTKLHGRNQTSRWRPPNLHLLQVMDRQRSRTHVRLQIPRGREPRNPPLSLRRTTMPKNTITTWYNYYNLIVSSDICNFDMDLIFI